MGGAGHDNVIGNGSYNRLEGGGGHDTINGGSGIDTVIGGDGDDLFVMVGGDFTDDVVGGTGTDTLDVSGITFGFFTGFTINLAGGTYTNGGGFEGPRRVTEVENVIGSSQGDNITGTTDANNLQGGAGNDTLNGGAGVDTLQGGLGDDIYFVNNAAALIAESTGEGNDRVNSSVSFTLAADDSIEILSTSSAAGVTAINLRGNALAQRIIGNAGNNTIEGGEGQDTLTGNGGADIFVFKTNLGAGANFDKITDFDPANDLFHLDNVVFTGLANGALAASAFAANLSGVATDALDRIIYETDTGDLFFDVDGTGAAARVRFAQITAGLPLTAADFLVI